MLRNLTFQALRGSGELDYFCVGGEGYQTDGLDGHYLIWMLSSLTNMDVQKTNPY